MMALLTVMNAMTVKSFVDTNIVLYTIGKDKHKVEISRNIIATKPIISAQVVNESISVCLRKFAFTKENSYAFADNLMRRALVVAVDENTIRKSAEIAIRYQISNWDALIIAAALLNTCDILYSEDMQHGQQFDGTLTIINPFLDK
jgi:predicted nucleic acid-binding protein